jgi:2-oxoglutarate ferredoxin oxidoreductase subunit beta
MSSMSDFSTGCTPTWCPGCGDFGIWASIKSAVVQMNWGPMDFCISYGIGCHGHMVNFLNSYAIETLHGRPVPVAEGIRLANNTLPTLVVAGDGDTFGEGSNHLMHAMRRNINLTFILHDNQVYGLTTGQTAPTSHKGFKSKSTPTGSIEEAVNPVTFALQAGATFVARGFAGDIPFTTKLIVEAMKHKGFAIVDVFQPCVTFNHVNTFQWYRDHIYHLEDSYQPTNKAEAFKRALEMEEKIPVGIFYREEKLSYEDQVVQIATTPLVLNRTPASDEVAKLLEEFV